jgi:predicted enzyme related to lactoylglutathione lyase
VISLAELIARFRSEDSFAAIELLCQGPDALMAAKAFSEAANQFYWKEKDLVSSIAMGRAGVQQALTAATRCSLADTARASELRGQAKAMAYNLASFTWPGWDEPGIVIGPSDLVTGMDAAKTNLRLGTELKKGPLPMSRAHWILAAHELAAGKHDDARKDFAKACEYADTAGAPADHSLSAGFAALTELLDGAVKSDESTSGLKQRLQEAEARLKTLEDGEMFIQQIHTAARVFGKGSPAINPTIGVDARLARHGGLSYLEVPAVDPRISAAFYESVVGWHLHDRDTDHPKFSDQSGHLLGRWETGRAIHREPGLLPFIYVERIDDVVARVAANGGEIVKPPYPEGNLKVATIRDPAGNLIGLWEKGS